MASISAKLEPKKFDCPTCIMQYGTNERLKGKTERKRRSKGCFDNKTKSYRLDNITYNTCIGNLVAPLDYLMDAFSLYEKGVLPFEGTLGDQPNKIIDVFDLIYHHRNVFTEKQK